MDLSIVIVNWNVKDFLKECLASVYRFSQDLEFEVFVVDNNSSDGSREMVARDFPKTLLIANSDNLGFSKANNRALEKCRGRYVLLLNPDTEILDNAMKNMVDYMDRRDTIDCLAPQLIYPDWSVQRSCRHFPSFFTDLMENLFLDSFFSKSMFFNRYRMGAWPHDRARFVDQPYGACLLFRAEVFKKIGLMDERFFMYYDEVDLCYRLKKAGGKIYFLPAIKIVHHTNKSSSQVSIPCEHYKYRSKFLFFEKHYGRWSLGVLGFTLFLREVLISVVFPVTRLVLRRPRDISYFKQYSKIAWQEYAFVLRRTAQADMKVDAPCRSACGD